MPFSRLLLAPNVNAYTSFTNTYVLYSSMPTDALLKTLPILQEQIDALIEFNANSNELTNGVINSAFVLLFKDLVRLFACYNDGKEKFNSTLAVKYLIVKL